MSKRSRGFESEEPHLQLKQVEISGFTKTPIQMELITYLLKSCISLERMIVNVQRREYKGAGAWEQHQPYGFSPSRAEVCNLLLSQKLKYPSVDFIVP